MYRRLLFFTLGRMCNTFMIPGTCYVPDAYTRYVLYRYLYIRAWVVVRTRTWVVVRMTPTTTFRPTNSCIASGWWYAWYLRSAQETAVSSRVPYEVTFSSRCTTKSIEKNSPTGSLPPAVPLAITRTFRPWTHTSDDSYIYQMSLVVATATVSSLYNNKLASRSVLGLDRCYSLSVAKKRDFLLQWFQM